MQIIFAFRKPKRRHNAKNICVPGRAESHAGPKFQLLVFNGGVLLRPPPTRVGRIRRGNDYLPALAFTDTAFRRAAFAGTADACASDGAAASPICIPLSSAMMRM